jgi:hypothetical protein
MIVPLRENHCQVEPSGRQIDRWPDQTGRESAWSRSDTSMMIASVLHRLLARRRSQVPPSDSRLSTINHHHQKEPFCGSGDAVGVCNSSQP